jgi:hypothetical protein
MFIIYLLSVDAEDILRKTARGISMEGQLEAAKSVRPIREVGRAFSIA